MSKKQIRSKHNNLLNYFICDKRDLAPAYVASCEKYLEEISRKLQASSTKLQAPRPALMMPQLKYINNLERNNMKNTIELLKKQHDVLVEVIQYLDSTKQSNTLIRSQVDTIVNFEKKLKEDSEMELTKIKLI